MILSGIAFEIPLKPGSGECHYPNIRAPSDQNQGRQSPDRRSPCRDLAAKSIFAKLSIASHLFLSYESWTFNESSPRSRLSLRHPCNVRGWQVLPLLEAASSGNPGFASNA